MSADIIEPVPEEPVGLGWYVSVFGGWSWPTDLEIELDTICCGGQTFHEEADIDLDSGFMAGAALGAQFIPWLRGEVEVSGNWHNIDSQVVTFNFSGPSTGTFTTTADGDANALFALANLWVDVPIGETIRPYIGGGIGIGRLDVQLESTAGAEILDGSDWGFAYQLGAGVAFGFMNMVFDVGYRFKAISANDIDVPTDYFTPLGDAEADYQSHNVLLGLRFYF
jgi:opacity protein-like surface antigen